jgi:hypothetical protein
MGGVMKITGLSLLLGWNFSQGKSQALYVKKPSRKMWRRRSKQGVDPKRLSPVPALCRWAPELRLSFSPRRSGSLGRALVKNDQASLNLS